MLQEPSSDVTPRLRTKAEAARILGVSLSTVERMVRDGELNARQIRGGVRISEDELDRFIAG